MQPTSADGGQPSSSAGLPGQSAARDSGGSDKEDEDYTYARTLNDERIRRAFKALKAKKETWFSLLQEEKQLTAELADLKKQHAGVRGAPPKSLTNK
jgi:hypothetical protein